MDNADEVESKDGAIVCILIGVIFGAVVVNNIPADDTGVEVAALCLSVMSASNDDRLFDAEGCREASMAFSVFSKAEFSLGEDVVTDDIIEGAD